MNNPNQDRVDFMMTGVDPKLEKVCRRCWIVKSLFAFSQSNELRDGLRNYCRMCARFPVSKVVLTKKYCPLCDQTKPIEDFYKKVSSRMVTSFSAGNVG